MTVCAAVTAPQVVVTVAVNWPVAPGASVSVAGLTATLGTSSTTVMSAWRHPPGHRR